MYRNKKVTALIMAAGSGLRFGAEMPKQFLDVGGEPMILSSARAFDESTHVDEILAVAASEHREEADALLGVLTKYGGSAAGAESRQESVRSGLRTVARARRPGDGGIVLIHDAARPFVKRDVIERVLAGVHAAGAAIACVPVVDTIYRANGEPRCGAPLFLSDAPARGLLWSVQTPQGFDLDMILRAHEAAAAQGFEATDDGAVAREYGGADVLIAMGDYANRKITTPEDMAPFSGAGDRVGIGFDVHAFAPDTDKGEKTLTLGGVVIPFRRALEGHSDADVLTHALMDAMLGALALGDIGKFFPDTDERYREISSMKLLADVKAAIEREGYILYNADTTVIAERPRMAGYIDNIRCNLAGALGTDPGRVGVKATTTEGLGFTGRGEGIGAQAVVRLARK